jgi:hypothetical protein
MALARVKMENLANMEARPFGGALAVAIGGRALSAQSPQPASVQYADAPKQNELDAFGGARRAHEPQSAFCVKPLRLHDGNPRRPIAFSMCDRWAR